MNSPDIVLAGGGNGALCSAVVAAEAGILFRVALTGLLLFWLGGTERLSTLLALHLGSVLAYFLLTPVTGMARAPYRMAALLSASGNKA